MTTTLAWFARDLFTISAYTTAAALAPIVGYWALVWAKRKAKWG